MTLSQNILLFIIHQMFSLTRIWSKHITWPNIPQLELGDIQECPPIFKTAHGAKTIWRIMNTIASIWGKNMLRYLFLDIISLYIVAHSSWKAVCFSEQIMSAEKYPSIFLCQMEAIVYVYSFLVDFAFFIREVRIFQISFFSCYKEVYSL